MNLQLRLVIAMFATLIGFGCASQDSVDVPAIALIGDSTVTDHKGWGAAFANALVGRVVVDDDAATQYYTVANVLGGWDPHTEAW